MSHGLILHVFAVSKHVFYLTDTGATKSLTYSWSAKLEVSKPKISVGNPHSSVKQNTSSNELTCFRCGGRNCTARYGFTNTEENISTRNVTTDVHAANEI